MPESLAKLIDLALLHPTMTDAELRAGCEKAKKLGVASVCIKPYGVALATAILRGTGVAGLAGMSHARPLSEANWRRIW
jgi:deoxyribose-phosphate aldolase